MSAHLPFVEVTRPLEIQVLADPKRSKLLYSDEESASY
ncbi:hypothetical protein AB205_0110320 [Aquarana catesbeiana]|uniref:Uncharacterized protein n=1 Tax=Aquarana catesbeiana TaxID=8400 RepID=A0A2G9RDD7_AQUCT|nr:hypothetical protein AB205_0110320 [Aquarana catesbeiana]